MQETCSGIFTPTLLSQGRRDQAAPPCLGIEDTKASGPRLEVSTAFCYLYPQALVTPITLAAWATSPSCPSSTGLSPPPHSLSPQCTLTQNNILSEAHTDHANPLPTPCPLPNIPHPYLDLLLPSTFSSCHSSCSSALGLRPRQSAPSWARGRRKRLHADLHTGRVSPLPRGLPHPAFLFLSLPSLPTLQET